MSDPTTNGTPDDSFARDPDDFFSETRMSFGDHIEELRRYLWKAIIGLGCCLVIGFVLDGIGYATEWPLFPGAKTGYLRGSYWFGRMKGEPVSAGETLKFGVGVPLMQIIQEPVVNALDEYEDRREAKIADQEKQSGIVQTQTVTFGKTTMDDVEFTLSAQSVAAIRGVKVDEVEPVTIREKSLTAGSITGDVPQRDFNKAVKKANKALRPRGLTALSVQEALVVYFKVSLVAGLVIASPWVFWQIWAFVAAGLYPHEKRLIHVYLPFSLGLFLAGVALCQFVVMPQAVSAMLWFNEWLGVEPDLRLNEWLSFAIWMPVIFGVSFQTPLVMLFMGKLGIADVPYFASKRKYAYFAMAVFSAMITPSPDAITMLLLALPMCLLYELGIILIKIQPKPEFSEEESETDELVEV